MLINNKIDQIKLAVAQAVARFICQQEVVGLHTKVFLGKILNCNLLLMCSLECEC